MTAFIRRREFITLVGSAAAAWPLAARAQQSAMPVIGYLAQGTPEATAGLVVAVRKGLGEAGLVESKDLSASCAGQATTPTGCLDWQMIWCSVGWRSLSP